MRSRGEAFRMSFLAVLVFILVFSTAIAVPLGAVLAWIRQGPQSLNVHLLALFTSAAVIDVLGLLFVPILVWYFKVYIQPDSLRAYDFWGIYRTVTWADMRSARPFNFLGLRFLRVHTAGARFPLWLPLFLNDPERFCRLVRQHAGPDHVLARALNDEMIGSEDVEHGG